MHLFSFESKPTCLCYACMEFWCTVLSVLRSPTSKSCGAPAYSPCLERQALLAEQHSKATHACLLLQVHVVELQLSRDEALRRHQAAAAAEAAGLEAVGLGAEASQSLLGEASCMPQPQQQSQQPEDQVGVPVCGVPVQKGACHLLPHLFLAM